MSVSVPISVLARSLDRSEAFLRIVMRSRGFVHDRDTIDLEEAIALIRYFSTQVGDQAKTLSDLDAQLQNSKQRELELSVAVEILRREKALVECQNDTLSKQLHQTTGRADRLEDRLHELTESFAHLLDQRDRLVARQQSKTSRVVEVRQDGKEVLLLMGPVSLPSSRSVFPNGY